MQPTEYKNRKFLDLLLTVGKIDSDRRKQAEKFIDSDADIKKECGRIFNICEDQDNYDELIDLMDIIINENIDYTQRFFDTMELQLKYRWHKKLRRIMDNFYGTKYFELTKDLRLFRVLNLWGYHKVLIKDTVYVMDKKMYADNRINIEIYENNESIEYGAIFVKNGVEEFVKSESLEDTYNILLRLIEDNYDLVLIAFDQDSSKLLNSEFIGRLNNNQYLELMLYLRGFWDITSLNSDIINKIKDSDINVANIIKVMHGAKKLASNTILEFSYQIIKQLEKIDKSDVDRYLDKIYNIMKFKCRYVGYASFEMHIKGLIDQLENERDIDKIITILKDNSDGDVNFLYDFKDKESDDNYVNYMRIENNDRDGQICIIARKHNVLEKYDVKSKELQDIIESGDYIFKTYTVE